MTTLYGIKNCDSVKKARKWLEQQEIPFQFHDFRTDGLNNDLLQKLLSNADLTLLLNKRSTTFRKLSDEIKNNLTDAVAVNAILEQPTLLKRPLLIKDNEMLIGFKEENYQAIFK